MKLLKFKKIKNRQLLQSINRIPGWLEIKEALILYNLARALSRGAVAVEIGSYQGKSTVWLGKALKKVDFARLYSIDHHCGSPEKGESPRTVNTWQKFNQNLRKFHLTDLVVPIRKKSTDAVIDFKFNIDLLFIDGDHRPKAVAKDWQTWKGKLKNGAWVIFHDATVLPGPWKVARDNILFSSSFDKVKMTGSMIYGRQCLAGGYLEKGLRRLTNYFKYLFIISYVKMRRIIWVRNLKSLVLNFFYDCKKR